MRPPLLLTYLFFALLTVHTSMAATPASPIQFFTNVASRLLKHDLQVDLHRIQIHPTNHYTAAVHRLLQVTANLHDSTTTNPYPTIFRPTFSREGANLFICGYEEVDATNVAFVSKPLNPEQAVAATPFPTRGNVYGIPWILGVKKGLPGFNKLLLISAFDVTRRIEAERPFMNSPLAHYRYWQHIVASAGHEFGIQFWNPYNEPFPVPVQVIVNLDVRAVLSLGDARKTNSWTVNFNRNLDAWPAASMIPFGYLNTNSFIPFHTNLVQLTQDVFLQTSNTVVTQNDFELVPLTPPTWSLELKSTFRGLIRESSTGRILDYVHLVGPDMSRDLDEEVQCETLWHPHEQLWNTNIVERYGRLLPMGVRRQLELSMGSPALFESEWNTYNGPYSTRVHEIARFKAFMLGSRQSYEGVTANNPTNLVLQAPFSPRRLATSSVTWEANDPLMHHDLASLGDPASRANWVSLPPNNVNPTTHSLPQLSQLSSRYNPWGGHPFRAGHDPLAYDMTLKDSSVRTDTSWNFPNGEPLTLATLGRIHRGTPWQTIYLKATNGISMEPESLERWASWTGIDDLVDALATVPVRDHHLVSLLEPLLRTQSLVSSLSINERDPAKWRAALDGIRVITNSEPLQVIVLFSNSPQAALIADAIVAARAQQPGRHFRGVGEILSVGELSDRSPFLNATEPRFAPSDEWIEALPAQLLPRLRTDSEGTAIRTSGGLQLRFSGYDGNPYALEASSDLLDWRRIQTNTPLHGTISFDTPLDLNNHYFRSILLP